MQIRLVDFEARLITLEDGMAELGKVLTEMKPALSESFVGTLNKRTEEIRDESRRYFVENFSKLVSAFESFEKRAEYIEADLQFLIEESNKGIVGVEQREQSTPISIIPSAVKSGGGIQVQVDKKNSLTGSSPTGRQLPKIPLDRSVTMSKPVREPPKFDGKSSWEAFLAQFEIAARMNGWNDEQKAQFLATSLYGNATLILSNMSWSDREDYAKLVMALTSRFGLTHQSDLARAKLKTRIKKREESLPELAESVESLARKAYPDASNDLQDILARDHFIDALYEEDLRLRVRQARPPSLQVALETALELESFQLASRHRTRMFRGAVGNVRLAEETGDELPSNQGGARCESKLDELNNLMTRWLKEIKAGSCGRFSNNRYRRSPELEQRKCWTCGVQGHLAKDCKRGPPNEIKTTRETKDEQSGNDRRSTYRGEDRPEEEQKKSQGARRSKSLWGSA